MCEEVIIPELDMELSIDHGHRQVVSYILKEYLFGFCVSFGPKEFGI